jgi:hypothetical protein
MISYQKHIDSQTTRELRLPMDGQSLQSLGTELATINGITYVSLPDGVSLPSVQPDEIAASISPVTLDAVLREQIKSASPHCKLISQRMIDKIRDLYSIDDEMYFARIGVGAANGMYVPTIDEIQAMTVFGAFVESIRQWGRDERARIGL